MTHEYQRWWRRMMISTLSADEARKFLIWGARGGVLLVRENIPGAGSQVRGWMRCAALTAYLLGRSYRVWTPMGCIGGCFAKREFAVSIRCFSCRAEARLHFQTALIRGL